MTLNYFIMENTLSWSIGVNVNTISMSLDVADKLIEAASEDGHDLYYSTKNGLSLDYDAMEHMDFFWNDWAKEILSDPSVNGDIVFSSNEGDNAGDIWGYRFHEGKRSRLIADITYKEVPE